jgi:hypothetical protein
MEEVIWNYSLKKGCEGPIPADTTVVISNATQKTSSTTTPNGDTIIEVVKKASAVAPTG